MPGRETTRWRWLRAASRATGHPLVAATVGGLLVLAIWALIPRGRHSLGQSDAVPRFVWILGLIALLGAVAALARRRQPDADGADAAKTARLARDFREHFMKLFEWEMGVLYEFREHHDRPDERHELRYLELREPLLRLHDELATELRAWLDGHAEERYDLRDPMPAEWDPVYVVQGPIDAPLTAFFDPGALADALSWASDWETREFEPRIQRYRETLDAFVRWAERQSR